MEHPVPLVLFLQLPIPPPGPQPIQANIPLAAGYLILAARRQGLDRSFRVEIVPSTIANDYGDAGLVRYLLDANPWMVCLSCYLWNVERSVWIAQCLKRERPDLQVVVGGPEICRDNCGVLEDPAVDYAIIGEGEQTFVELLQSLERSKRLSDGIDGLVVRGSSSSPRRTQVSPDDVSSPYLEGILDGAQERVLFLETLRGCTFRCNFCYYPKSYDRLHFLSAEKIAASLDYAARHDVREVVLLDPTLNQRRDFADFLRLLARHNPDGQFTYSGELRAEGITDELTQLLRQANFTELEIGLQSIDPEAQRLMGRRVNLSAFGRGVQAMLDAGIRVRVDLILGLPGDTVDSIRRGIDYLVSNHAYREVQLFPLSILPGTAFRHQAAELGLGYQSRPPYYVLKTPTLSAEQLVELMEEGQEAFGIEFDPLPPPVLDLPDAENGLVRVEKVDLDLPGQQLQSAAERSQAFTLWLKAANFDQRKGQAAALVARTLDENPHTTLQVLVEPGDPGQLSPAYLKGLLAACYRKASYLDLYYSLHPRPLLGAKRLVVIVPAAERNRLGPTWIRQVGRYAALVWLRRGEFTEPLEEHEYLSED